MKIKTHKSKNQYSPAASIGIGAGIAIVLSILLTLLLSKLAVNGSIGEDKLSPFVFATRTISILIGGLIGAKLSEGKYLPIIGIIASVYLIVLIGLGIGVYGSSFQDFISGAASVLAGGVIACLIKLKPTGNTKKHRRYAH